MYFNVLVITIILSSLEEINCANVGSALFWDKNVKSGCWSDLDISMLRARKIFEQLSFNASSPQVINGKYIRNIINYFKMAMRSLEKGNDRQSTQILKRSLGDMIGGHLRYEILPTTRYSYYAGYVPYKEARSIHDYYEDIRKNLNVLGLGWKEPSSVPRLSNLTVSKILIGRNTPAFPCKKLILKRDTTKCIHIPLPKIDDHKEPSAISLPFKHNGFVSLRSPKSENMVLKYYISGAKCILQSSPRECRSDDFVAFNNQLWHWMKRDVATHLADEQLYAAYGGILRVAAAVQNYGKGLARRNLFDTKEKSSWLPWKRHSCDEDHHTSSLFYIILVVILAAAIYFLQIIQNYIFATPACTPKRSEEIVQTANVDYTSVESNIPSILPSHNQLHKKMSSSSRNSVTKQNSEKIVRYFDLNKDGSNIDDSTGSESASMPKNTKSKRSDSPPKIIPEITQLRLANTTTSKEVITPIFSSWSSKSTESTSDSGSSTDSSTSQSSSRHPSRQLM